MAHCSAMLCPQVTLSGDAEWPKVADAVIEALIAAVKKAATDGASLEEMKKAIGDQLASKYEEGMSKYPLGRYRDRVGQNVAIVYQKVVKKG